MYYCTLTTPDGVPDIIKIKWIMLPLHVQNIHGQCTHESLRYKIVFGFVKVLAKNFFFAFWVTILVVSWKIGQNQPYNTCSKHSANLNYCNCNNHIVVQLIKTKTLKREMKPINSFLFVCFLSKKPWHSLPLRYMLLQWHFELITTVINNFRRKKMS